ncbi:MAG: ribosome-associated translation inhibitor RaiA [Caulobacteraceae bacterium]|nr:ribosome-associated translation inhibitor RaiA [Caulobacter sp.]
MLPDAKAPIEARFDVEVSGKQMEVGDALRQRITDDLVAGIARYFDRGGDADVHVRRDGHGFCVDVVVRLATGQRLVASGTGGDAHAAFDAALKKIETRVRRYKRRLVSHKPHIGGGGSARAEPIPYTVLRAPDDEDDLATDEWGADGSAGDGAPAAAIIAETQKEVRTGTVSMAVMELDLTDAPVVMFRNAAHGGLSVVYRRADGNIGWLDPERGRSAG